MDRPALSEELVWYARNARLLVRVRSQALVAAGMIEGALLLHLDYEDSHGAVVKSAYHDGLSDLLESAVAACDECPATRVQSLAAALRALDFKFMMEARRTRPAAQQFYWKLHAIAKTIDDLQLDFESIAGAALDAGAG